MSGVWEAVDGTDWRVSSHFYEGRCCIDLSRYPDSHEREKEPGITRIEIGRIYLSRNDIEVLYKMMIAESRPNEKG